MPFLNWAKMAWPHIRSNVCLNEWMAVYIFNNWYKSPFSFFHFFFFSIFFFFFESETKKPTHVWWRRNDIEKGFVCALKTTCVFVEFLDLWKKLFCIVWTLCVRQCVRVCSCVSVWLQVYLFAFILYAKQNSFWKISFILFIRSFGLWLQSCEMPTKAKC